MKNPRFYAGIGSRQTPPEVLTQMIQIARHLSREGWVLRSGGASGADSAFEQGCDLEGGEKEILLPWRRFNQNRSTLWLPTFGPIRDKAMALASEVHPAWLRMSSAGRCLHARNVMQILGPNLDSPVDLVICWTEGGKVVGGTATAIKLAEARGTPVHNLFSMEFDLLILWHPYDRPARRREARRLDRALSWRANMG